MENRWKTRRDTLRGGPPRTLAPCGTYAAARRHQRAHEALCGACRSAYNEHQRNMQQLRKAKGTR